MILRVISYCVIGGLLFTLPALSTGHLAWALLSGILLTLAFVPVARFGPRSLAGQFGIIASVLIVVGLVCTMSEAMLFLPEMKLDLRTALGGGAVFYLVAALALAALAKLLKLIAADAPKAEMRPAPLLVPMVIASALSYVLYYLVFGMIAFQFFTRQYYPHAAEHVGVMGAWFWAYQFGRGLLMTLAVLPVIYALRLPRWQAALAVGAIVWIAGGGASLLIPNTYMVAAQRYTHIVEIMMQNFSLGATAVLLMRQKSRTAATAEQPAGATH